MQEDGLNRERTLVKMHVACARRVVAVLVTAAPRAVPNIGTAEPSAPLATVVVADGCAGRPSKTSLARF